MRSVKVIIIGGVAGGYITALRSLLLPLMTGGACRTLQKTTSALRYRIIKAIPANIFGQMYGKKAFA